MKRVLAVSMILAVSSTFAKPVNLPTYCKPDNYRFYDKQVVLKMPKYHANDAAIWLVYNQSTQPIWLVHPTAHHGASAGWSSYLTAGHWTAVMVGHPQFTLACHLKDQPLQPQDCQSLLTICQLTTVAIPTQAKGTYWLAEDLSLPALQRQLQQRGIQLPTP
ncbi:MAG: hypothetical protein HWD59_14285 [Coxiellaceae bacterium]|nr:MAG: hypothetical protein HWD59_14285 [Coxiellaceae bacterium]